MDYNLNKTRFNHQLRSSLKFLNEAKNIANNNNELFCHLKDIKDTISKIENIVNNKGQFTGLYTKTGKPICIGDTIDINLE
jgi:hypothetical protein